MFLGRGQRGVVEIIARLPELRLVAGDRRVHPVDLRMIIEIGAFELGLGLEMRRFCHVHAALPLLDVLGGGGILLHQNVEGVLLIAFIGQLSQRQRNLMHRDVDVGFEDVDVLLGRGQLRLNLCDLVFIRAAIELEQRLALFHPIIVLDQHLGDERRAGQSRDELDRVLNDCGVSGGRRHEPEADHEYEHDVNHEKRENEPPARGQPQQFELEEDEPEDRGGADEDQDRGHHGV